MRIVLIATGFALAVSITMVGAQTTPRSRDRLERLVIVMRHGVRSAMSSPEELGQHGRRAWPRFAVPPGHLTTNSATPVTMLDS
jgi:4-phytase/acid phosphatase